MLLEQNTNNSSHPQGNEQAERIRRSLFTTPLTISQMTSSTHLPFGCIGLTRCVWALHLTPNLQFVFYLVKQIRPRISLRLHPERSDTRLLLPARLLLQPSPRPFYPIPSLLARPYTVVKALLNNVHTIRLSTTLKAWLTNVNFNRLKPYAAGLLPPVSNAPLLNHRVMPIKWKCPCI